MTTKLSVAINFSEIYNKADLNPGVITIDGSLTVGEIISELLPYIFTAAGLVLLLYLLYGGFHLIMSGGDPKAIQEAKGKITNALVGFIIIFVAYWLVQAIGKVLGADGFGGTF